MVLIPFLCRSKNTRLWVKLHGDRAEKLGITVSATQVRSSGQQLAEIASLLENKTIVVKINSTFYLADAAKAHERAEGGNIQGKIVLHVI